MIKINLLPSSEQRKGSGGASSPAASGFKLFMLLIVLGLGGVGYYGYLAFEREQESMLKAQQAAAKVEKTKASIKNLKKEYEELAELSERINTRFAIVQALANPETRLFWSEKINMLAALRMQLAVYITRLELQEDIEDRETPESVARREAWQRDTSPTKGPEPKAQKVPVIKQRLLINAIAYGTDSPQRLRQIRGFINELRTFKWKRRRSGKEVAFVDNLDPNFEVGDQRTDIVAEVEVSRFSIVIRALEQTVDTTQLNAPAPAPAPAAPAKADSVSNSSAPTKG
jgi:hypothetical protein